MKLTTKKLEKLIQEAIEDGYNREQKRKDIPVLEVVNVYR